MIVKTSTSSRRARSRWRHSPQQDQQDPDESGLLHPTWRRFSTRSRAEPRGDLQPASRARVSQDGRPCSAGQKGRLASPHSRLRWEICGQA